MINFIQFHMRDSEPFGFSGTVIIDEISNYETSVDKLRRAVTLIDRTFFLADGRNGGKYVVANINASNPASLVLEYNSKKAKYDILLKKVREAHKIESAIKEALK